MIQQLKTFTLKMVAGANIATIVVMFLIGYSDFINPIKHPMLSTIGLAFPIVLAINLCFLFFWLIVLRRMAFIPIIGFIMCYIPVRKYIPFNVPHDTPIGCIKILSYNVHGYVYSFGDENPFERIISYIRKNEADIVCLQEDLGDWLRPQTHLDSIYPYHDKTIVGSQKMNALGIYTRFPILRVEPINYESQRNGSVAYWLDVNGKTIIVVNNHFESNRLTLDDKERYKNLLRGNLEGDTAKKETRYIADKLADATCRRAPQADVVARFIKTHADTPLIVCGDFNDSPISYTHRIVSDGLIDCYVRTANGPGLSYNQKGFNVRIDNIFCSDHFTPYNCRVDNKIHASDHYPIYCWLKFGYKP
ncbi:MAG: endonuclease/exonuclease/phosphatase family protein [Prevotella sp.]